VTGAVVAIRSYEKVASLGTAGFRVNPPHPFICLMQNVFAELFRAASNAAKPISFQELADWQERWLESASSVPLDHSFP
jgi:hypothetical protein